MIVIVDVMLGPTLTFIVFKPGKKGLALDLGLIAGVQICALVYGASVIYIERPQFLAFAVDRFVMVSSHDVEQNKFKFPALLKTIQRGPLPVFAKMPTDPIERSRLFKETMEGKPDLEFRAEYYEPVDQHVQGIFARSKPINNYRQVSTEYQQKIDHFIKTNCGSPEACAYFPLVGKERSMMLVMQRNNGEILGAIDINPWTSVKAIKQAIKI